MRRRRPAAAPRLRRPAAADPVVPDRRVEDVRVDFEAGRSVLGRELPIGTLPKGCPLLLEEATYYGRQVQVAAIYDKEEIDDGERELHCQMTGTKDEEALKVGIATTPCWIRVHLCREGCPATRVGPLLFHTHKLRKHSGGERTWEDNLKVDEQMGQLQDDHQSWAKQGMEKQKVKSSSSSGSKKKKKKKKKRKKKEVGEGSKEKRNKGEEDSPGKQRRRTQKMGGKSVAKKDLIQVFGGTGLDPDHRLRRRLVHRVKKRLKKGKETSSSSSSSSAGDSEETEAEMLMEDRNRVHRIAAQAPGLLTAMGVEAMKPFLVQVGNTGWQDEGTNLPPILSQYARTYVMGKMTGGVHREFSSLAWIGDLGRIAEGMDCLFQRMKSLELVSKGEAWQSAQKLELVPPLEPSLTHLTQRSERQLAQKEGKLDRDVKGNMVNSEKGKGKSKDKWSDRGNDRGKDRGKGKQKEGEKPKGGGQ